MTAPLANACVFPDGSSVVFLLVWILRPIVPVCLGGLAGFVKRFLRRIYRVRMKKRRLRNPIVILLHLRVVQPNGVVAIYPIMLNHHFCINTSAFLVEGISSFTWKFTFKNECAYH